MKERTKQNNGDTEVTQREENSKTLWVIPKKIREANKMLKQRNTNQKSS